MFDILEVLRCPAAIPHGPDVPKEFEIDFDGKTVNDTEEGRCAMSELARVRDDAPFVLVRYMSGARGDPHVPASMNSCT